MMKRKTWHCYDEFGDHQFSSDNKNDIRKFILENSEWSTIDEKPEIDGWVKDDDGNNENLLLFVSEKDYYNADEWAKIVQNNFK